METALESGGPDAQRRSPSRRALLVILSLLVLSGSSWAKYSDQSNQITEGSEEGQNLKAAAELIRQLGNPEKADNILEMLRDGRIYWDPTLKENGDTDNVGVSKDMTISSDLIHHTLPNSHEYDAYTDTITATLG